MHTFSFGIFVLVVLAMILASVVMTLTRVVNWVVNGLFPKQAVLPLQPMMPRTQQCRRANCRTANPMHARFCRRCGVSLSAAQVDLRRVAAVL